MLLGGTFGGKDRSHGFRGWPFVTADNPIKGKLRAPFSRMNITPADVIPADSKPEKPARESRLSLRRAQVVATKVGWIPARAWPE